MSTFKTNFFSDAMSAINKQARQTRDIPATHIIPTADVALSRQRGQGVNTIGRENALTMSKQSAIAPQSIETSVGKVDISGQSPLAPTPSANQFVPQASAIAAAPSPATPGVLQQAIQDYLAANPDKRQPAGTVPAAPVPTPNPIPQAPAAPAPAPIPAPAPAAASAPIPNLIPQAPLSESARLSSVKNVEGRPVGTTLKYSPVVPYNPLTPDAQRMAPPSPQLLPQVVAANSIDQMRRDQFRPIPSPGVPSVAPQAQAPNLLPGGIPPPAPGDIRTPQQRLDQIAQGRAESATSPNTRSYFINGQWQTRSPNDPQVLALQAAAAPLPPAPITDVTDPNYFTQYPQTPNMQELQAVRATVAPQDIPGLVVSAQNLTPPQFLKELHRVQDNLVATRQAQTEQQTQASQQIKAEQDAQAVQKQKDAAAVSERQTATKYANSFDQSKMTVQGRAARRLMLATGKIISPSSSWFVNSNDALKAQRKYYQDPAHRSQLKPDSLNALIAANAQGRTYNTRPTDFRDPEAEMVLQHSIERTFAISNAKSNIKKVERITQSLQHASLTDQLGLRTKLRMAIDNLLSIGGIDPSVQNDLQNLRTMLNNQVRDDTAARKKNPKAPRTPVTDQTVVHFNELAQRATKGFYDQLQAAQQNTQSLPAPNAAIGSQANQPPDATTPNGAQVPAAAPAQVPAAPVQPPPVPAPAPAGPTLPPGTPPVQPGFVRVTDGQHIYDIPQADLPEAQTQGVKVFP